MLPSVTVTTCPTCSGAGVVLEGTHARRCACVERRRREGLLAGAGVPARYLAELPLPGLVSTWLEGAERARPRRGLCLVGGVGTGKSTAAGAVVRRLVLAHGLTARWVPLGSWLVESALARRRDDVAPPTPATLAEPELLVLDDVGSSGELAGPARELLEDLVGRVYDADRLLVFTSNVPPGELGPMVGPRISSRLHALTEVIRLVGADRRRAAA